MSFNGLRRHEKKITRRGERLKAKIVTLMEMDKIIMGSPLKLKQIKIIFLSEAGPVSIKNYKDRTQLHVYGKLFVITLHDYSRYLSFILYYCY